MDAAGVDAALLHPPGWDPNGNPVAIEAAKEHPERLTVLGHCPLDRPESRAAIETWKHGTRTGCTCFDKELIMGRAVCDWLGWRPKGYTA